jgi:hypothetical protein
MRKMIVPVLVLVTVSLQGRAANRLFGPVRLSAPAGSLDLRGGGFKAGAGPEKSALDGARADSTGEKASPVEHVELSAPSVSAKAEKPVEEKLPSPIVERPAPAPVADADDPAEIKLEAPSVVSRSESDISIPFPAASDSAGIDAASASVLERVKGIDGYTLKLVSYYDGANRNVAFARLLNMRKALLDGGVPASRMMILVEESAKKNNTVGVTVLK